MENQNNIKEETESLVERLKFTVSDPRGCVEKAQEKLVNLICEISEVVGDMQGIKHELDKTIFKGFWSDSGVEEAVKERQENQKSFSNKIITEAGDAVRYYCYSKNNTPPKMTFEQAIHIINVALSCNVVKYDDVIFKNIDLAKKKEMADANTK